MISERSLIIKNYLQRFSYQLIGNMEKISEKFEELEKKHLSLDLYFEELKQMVIQKKMEESENEEILKAKQRQNRFIVS